MHASNYWINHFKANASIKRVNWNSRPAITPEEINIILPSLQAWQLGETSEGRNLIAASTKYADKISDPDYVEAVKLFIKEEQKHGNNLGLYLDGIEQPRIKKDWGDSLFRRVRYLNTSMEIWTLAVIVVESTAQIFYQSLKDATECGLLKEICTDILIDEAYHITFQTERLAMIFERKNPFSRSWRKPAYRCFFYASSTLVWFAHKTIFKAGGNTFETYKRKMDFKYAKTIKMITSAQEVQWDY
ncbi:MAG: ferritin-like domain-containing protein [Mucilaginibacter sp.]|uniref:ferritin-like domain-containing protein n=1 Tax=Mucilaginibacter sp. TaxID=1882438 RepID=UPI0031A36A89